ncbi:MAG: hypothetical protein JXR46_06220 [Calditrichaceae bacterium]|nr:hypothetical protein [Calditrichaceae bacterium]MBN2708622.1 hypothetical protein [Calditrichaceae bacterium]RQV95472.1 MAG: hypothetical protein EH224_07580 [Calditrichota bacterium]
MNKKVILIIIFCFVNIKTTFPQILVADIIDSVEFNPISHVLIKVCEKNSKDTSTFFIVTNNNRIIYNLENIVSDTIEIFTFSHEGIKISVDKSKDTSFQKIVFKNSFFYTPKIIPELEEYQKRIRDKLLKNPNLVTLKITDINLCNDTLNTIYSDSILLENQLKLEIKISNNMDESIFIPDSLFSTNLNIHFASDSLFSLFNRGFDRNFIPYYKYSELKIVEIKSNSSYTIWLKRNNEQNGIDKFWVKYSPNHKNFFKLDIPLTENIKNHIDKFFGLILSGELETNRYEEKFETRIIATE